MNNRQKKAADIFIVTGDGRQALKKAGYSDDYAKKYKAFFEKEDVQAYIKGKIRPIVTDEEENSPSEEIIEYLKRVMRGDEDTNPTQRMKAAEILCRHYGINKENKTENGEEAEMPRPVVICDDVRE